MSDSTYYNDLKKVGPIFRGANGGIADDLFTGITNSYYSSDKIEVLEDANAISPKVALRTLSCELGLKSTLGSEIEAIVPISSYDSFIFCQKAIVKAEFDGSTWTTTTLWTASGSSYYICDAEKFAGRLFFSTRNYLYSIDWDTAKNATSTWSSSDLTSFTLNYTSYHPLYASDVLLAIGNGYTMSKIKSSTLETLETGYTMQEDYTIRFIGELGGYLRVVSDDGGYGSEIQLWDKSKKATTETIPLPGYKFLQSFIYEGYHYLLSDKGLGLLNGYQFYVLKKFKSEYLSADAVNNGMCVYDDKLYFAKQSGWYIYGAKNKNYSEVLHQWESRYDSYGHPYAIETDGQYLYTSDIHRNSANTGTYLYYNVYIPDDGYCNEGELQTRAYYGTSMSEIKQSEYLRVGYNLDTGYIKVYYRTEADAATGTPDDWERHELTQEDGLKTTSDMRAPFATTLKLNCRFQWIQFKFELKGYVPDTNIGRKTRLYSADLYYTNMLD